MIIGELCALAAALLWSFSPFIFTSAALRIGTLQLNITRSLLATIFLGITLLIFQININFSLYQIFFLTLSGITGLVLGDTFLFKAFKTIGPRVAMLIMAINPAFTAIIAYIWLGESLSIIAILGMFLTLIGIAFVILEKPTQEKVKFKISISGVFYGFIAALGQAVGLIFAKLSNPIKDVPNMLSATFIRLGSAALVLFIGATLIKKFKNPIILFKNDIPSFKLVVIGSIIGPYLGVTLSFFAIIFTPQAGIAATLTSITPILMLPLSRIIYKEKLTWKGILGAFIAILGVILLFIKDIINTTFNGSM
jgi:drug/metabolite transporter (DMT)-like permease